ncbi:MAG TPA: PARP-type zinc finger-containing protein [Steroidobacteraceae bacterium]|nr:PARP-type zinc finger-containing protein [Steroidobacteraceae bacterium]
MAHVIEPASSARAKCRGCGERIAKDTLRLGERLANPYGEGEMTHWFHLTCGAYKRPEPFLEALRATTEEIEDVARLEHAAQHALVHRRLPRIDGAQRASSARANCRHCHELIERGAWRIRLVYYEEGRFKPSGYVHLRCTPAYFGTTDVVDHVRQFSPALTESDLAEIRAGLVLPGA